MNIPKNLKGEDLARFLVANKSALIENKMALNGYKEADAFSFVGGMVSRDGSVTKDGAGSIQGDGTIKNTTIINTCLWYDSHGDVHIPKLWNKSLADNAKRPVNQIMLLQEHLMKFDKIIADKSNVVPYVTKMTWKQLGVDFPGSTEVLAFDNIITPTRNPAMFKEYSEGNVSNHSVGMRYVDIELAINTGERDMKAYKEVWDRYIDLIANKEDVEFEGYFWAVTQAKVIEGSAVVRGSNIITPTISQKGTEPSPDTPNGPGQSTQAAKGSIFQVIKSIKR